MQKLLGRRVFLFVFVGIPLLALTVLLVSGLPYVLSVTRSEAYHAAHPVSSAEELLNSYWLSLPALPADGGLLDVDHCERPCILGIIPGKTPLAHLSALDEHYDLGCDEKNLSGTLVSCTTNLWQVNLEVNHFSQEILHADITYTDLALGEMVDSLGTPSWLYMDSSLEWQSSWTNILFFDDSQIAAWLREPQNFGSQSGEFGYPIGADTQVEKVELIPTEEYPHCCGLNWGAFYLPWEGYGIYSPNGNETIDF